MVSKTKSTLHTGLIAILAVAFVGFLELSNISVEDQANAKRPTDKEYRKTHWLDFGHNEYIPKLEQRRPKYDPQENRLGEYDLKPVWSDETSSFEPWADLEKRLRGSPILESVYTWLLGGVALLLFCVYFALLRAVWAGCLMWCLAYVALLIVYGLFSDFEYSDHVTSAISVVSAVFVGIPVFVWVLWATSYETLTGRQMRSPRARELGQGETGRTS